MRASGPGGQNVNKVSSAVELRFEAATSPSLPAPVKNRLRRLAGRRWTNEGALVLQCDETRSQARNRDIVRERLAELISTGADPAETAHRHPPDAGIKETPPQGQKGARRGQSDARQGRPDT